MVSTLKMIDQSSQGQSVSEIVGLFYLHPSTARSYIHRYNSGSLESLKSDYGVGRSVEITLSKAEMEELISQSPSQFEKLEPGARNWPQGLPCQYLWPYHQPNISQCGISDTLKRLGIVWRRAKKSDLCHLGQCLYSYDP